MAFRTFDVAFMANVFHIIQDPRAVLRECHRLLKSDGRLLCLSLITN
ncbi:MAG: hypothetical protein COS92_01765 [Desulfobacterales bacterium CG07_land_8_20_14_0_80_52_14]|nr:MAG: hypothetical protein COX20_05240 [Desulfobacterales bacterium CG23_combo_of_CG06-09_8_20_14_all_52_9]PIU50376.1 MAG: hypothetical protein COS92_01765 [Desulfobacterales bacterium CG07_land_8_20_14_0_80_52_14]